MPLFYLLGFFAPRLNTSTSALRFAIIGLGAPTGLTPLDLAAGADELGLGCDDIGLGSGFVVASGGEDEV